MKITVETKELKKYYDSGEYITKALEGFRKEGRSEGVSEGKLEEKQNTLKEQLEI